VVTEVYQGYQFEISNKLAVLEYKEEITRIATLNVIFSLLFRYNPLPILFELSFFVQLISNTDHSMKFFDIIYSLQLTHCDDLHDLQLTFYEILHCLQLILCDVLNSSADIL